MVQVDEFYSSLKKDPRFQNFMPAEVVQLINHRPSNVVILQVHLSVQFIRHHNLSVNLTVVAFPMSTFQLLIEQVGHFV